ncbi:MAG: hypothetical protein AAGF77_01250 [Bacteroidota bacterium]
MQASCLRFPATLFQVLAIAVVTVLCACRNDFEYTPSTGGLTFSKDTVFLDTIFANIASSTYTLKVYNTGDTDILIPEIKLGRAASSRYRLNVDGLDGQEFQEIPLLARDSLFVFVETTVDSLDFEPTTLVYTDDLLFGAEGNFQKVVLNTLVQKARFLFPRAGNGPGPGAVIPDLEELGSEVPDNSFWLQAGELNFNSDLPVVIYGYATVPEDSTLTIAAGTRVYFHQNSGLLVGPGASLNITGALSTDDTALENEVVFEGDRLEPGYSQVPGQWGTVWLSENSVDNSITNLTIKNATVGMIVDGNITNPPNALPLVNVQIHNSAITNLWAHGASINLENCILGNAGGASVDLEGGRYDFVHCTLANYWARGFRDTPTLTLRDTEDQNLEMASFENCVVDGNRSNELLLLPNTEAAFNFKFAHCALKFPESSTAFADNPLYNFEDTNRYIAITRNPKLSFTDPLKEDFSLQEDSEVLNLGDPTIALRAPLDLLGNDRTERPDLGALQYTTKN